MKTIFETFKKSIYNPVFYREAVNDSFLSILKYYAKFILLLSLLMMGMLGAYLIPQVVTFVSERAPYLVQEYYPKDLSVHIEKGIASANVDMPYFVPIKEIFKASTTNAIQNMLVIDTTQDFDKARFEQYSTYVLLTKTDIVSMNSNGGITLQPLKPFSTITINQDTLMSWVAVAQNSLWWVALIGLLAIFVILYFGFLMYLIPLLLFALFPLALAYLKKSTLSYESAYKMSLYAILPALVLKSLLNIFNVAGMFFLPEYFTLLVFMLVIAVNMREESETTLFENNN
jgi:hypothetical protein